MASQLQLSVVIPVFNEVAIVEAAATELAAAIQKRGWDYEIILSENGSRDGTQAVLERICASNPRIRALHSDQPNYGAALKAGIMDALGEVVVCDEIDLCDISFYDAAIPKIQSGEADMVIGSKAAHGASDRRPLIRRVATRVHNSLLRMSLGFKGTDTHGLKAFRRDRLVPIAQQCVVDRDVFASEFVLRAWRSGLSVQEIPIQLVEKRQPSVHLFKRVPHVLKSVARLVYVIRVRGG